MTDSDCDHIAFEPEYTLGAGGEPIELYRGPFEAEGVTRDAVVRLDWLPRPQIAIHSTGPTSPNPFIVRFPELKAEANACLLRARGSSYGVEAVISPMSSLSVGETCGFAYVAFHMVNLRDYLSPEPVRHVFEGGYSAAQRLAFEAEGWKVTLDSVRDENRVFRRLRDIGGHAITYTGRMERTDGSTFGKAEVESLGTALESFLSFLNGDRCSIVLPVAYDHAGQRIWRGWIAASDYPWTGKPNWTMGLPARFLTQAFPGFLRLWQNPEWRDAIGWAIEWYLQGKRGTPEACLLLAQSALELVGWVQFVESSSGTMSEKDYDKLKASGRIRKLLDLCAMEYDIPEPYSALNQVHIDQKILVDGPHAITGIRNNIVHPKKTNRTQVLDPDETARKQAANLALYYLECILLNRFEYKGLNFIPATTLYFA